MLSAGETSLGEGFREGKTRKITVEVLLKCSVQKVPAALHGETNLSMIIDAAGRQL